MCHMGEEKCRPSIDACLMTYFALTVIAISCPVICGKIMGSANLF